MTQEGGLARPRVWLLDTEPRARVPFVNVD